MKILYKILIYLIPSIILSSCVSIPKIKIEIDEQIIPKSAFSAKVKIINNKKRRIKINEPKFDHSLIFYISESQKEKWYSVEIGNNNYEYNSIVSDPGMDLINKISILPNDTIVLDLELIPNNITEENNREYSLRLAYYTGNKRRLFPKSKKIFKGEYPHYKKFKIYNINFKSTVLKGNDKEAYLWLKENLRKDYSFSVKIFGNKVDNEKIYEFIQKFENSIYSDRAKLIYSLNFNSIDKVRANEVITFLEELKTEGKLSHLNWAIEKKLVFLREMLLN